MVFFVDIQDLYRRYDYSSGTTYNGHVVPHRAGGLYTAPPGRGRNRFSTTTTIESTVGGGSRGPGAGGTTTSARVDRSGDGGLRGSGTGNSFEQVTVETTSSFQSAPPTGKDGKVKGRQPTSGESYGMREDFLFNEKGELVGRDGRIIGRPPKQGERFGIDTDFIITINGEYITKDGKMIGRIPRSGDYTINSKGQYVLKNGTILDHAPDSGQYLNNEFGEFVTRDGKIIGHSIGGFGDGLSTSNEADVSGITGRGKLHTNAEESSCARGGNFNVDGSLQYQRAGSTGDGQGVSDT